MKLTPTDAKSKQCPLARTFGAKEVDPKCRADDCVLWRWHPLQMDAAHRQAIQTRMSDTSESQQKATKHVLENPGQFGLPTSPTHGYCGLGGKPDA